MGTSGKRTGAAAEPLWRAESPAWINTWFGLNFPLETVPVCSSSQQDGRRSDRDCSNPLEQLSTVWTVSSRLHRSGGGGECWDTPKRSTEQSFSGCSSNSASLAMRSQPLETMVDSFHWFQWKMGDSLWEPIELDPYRNFLYLGGDLEKRLQQLDYKFGASSSNSIPPAHWIHSMRFWHWL